jgi:hypothetical protein
MLVMVVQERHHLILGRLSHMLAAAAVARGAAAALVAQEALAAVVLERLVPPQPQELSTLAVVVAGTMVLVQPVLAVLVSS